DNRVKEHATRPAGRDVARRPELVALRRGDRRRHDPDDTIGPVVDHDTLTKNRRVGAEAFAPQLLAQHDDRRATLLRFVVRERAAAERFVAVHVEVFGVTCAPSTRIGPLGVLTIDSSPNEAATDSSDRAPPAASARKVASSSTWPSTPSSERDAVLLRPLPYPQSDRI